MNRKKTVLVFLVILLLIISNFSSQAESIKEQKIIIPSARTSAIGGPHAALADNLTTLFSNPAGFVAAGPQFSFVEITLGLSGPIFDIASIITQGGGAGIETLLASSNVQGLLQKLYAGMNLAGPIYFGYVGKGLGFGFFNTSEVTFASSAAFTLTATLREQLVLCGGYAFHIPFPESTRSSLDFGVLLKGSLRGESVITKSLLELPALFSSISVNTVLNQPFSFISAIGFDAGVRFSFKEVLTFGLAARDIFTPTLRNSYTTLQNFLDNVETPVKTNGIIPLDLSFGVLFSPKLGSVERYITDLKLMLDYSDILDFITHKATARNPLLHIGFGAEIVLLELFSLRAGFYDGLFAAGLGMNLTFFTLNAAMFGRELSIEPGLKPVYNVMVGLEFRI
ncbi:MAG: hypothetical protein AB1798_04985 [Spirochaetota bacterium]